MAIRLSGLISGLDTDSLVSELVSAYSTKKNTYVKAQTKLEWKQDSWKALNTKIYNLYSKTISDMRYSSTYKKKSTTVSDATKATVVASNNSINGTQTLSITQLAKSGYLTGAELKGSTKYTTSTKLSELGITSDSSFNITVGSSGNGTNINIGANSTIGDVVSALKKAGVNANFDATNQRIFISSKSSGAENDFSLTATDSNGMNALKSLGLYTMSTTDISNYSTWAAYGQSDIDSMISARYETSKTNAEAEIKILQNSNTALTTEKNKLVSQNETKTKEKEITQYKLDYANLSETDAQLQMDSVTAQLAVLNDKVNAGETLTEEEKAQKADLESKLAAMNEVDTVIQNDTLTPEDIEAYKTGLSDSIDAATAVITNNETRIAEIEGEVAENEAIIAGTSGNTTIEEIVADKNAVILNNITTEITNRWTTAQSIMDDYNTYLDYQSQIDSGTVLEGADLDAYNALVGQFGTSAIKIEGQNAEIYLNGAKFTGTGNSITVNGLTITAKELTGYNEDGSRKEISINTADDNQGIYDTIKNFIKQYNTLINEMDSLYNASAAKGYEPLTDEEKESMTDSQIEKWEEKIKEALFRKDPTLNSVSTAMKTAMMKSYTVNGKSYSLSSFGINTLSYFMSAENEKNAYHIDGDSDNSSTSGNKDKLMTAIATDPDAVASFFSQLTTGLYEAMDNKMKSTTLSSAYTVYNDKQMKTEYSDYTSVIKKWEEKIKDLEDYYYKKFSAMETALSKLQSSTTALASLLGS